LAASACWSVSTQSMAHASIRRVPIQIRVVSRRPNITNSCPAPFGMELFEIRGGSQGGVRFGPPMRGGVPTPPGLWIGGIWFEPPSNHRPRRLCRCREAAPRGVRPVRGYNADYATDHQARLPVWGHSRPDRYARRVRGMSAYPRLRPNCCVAGICRLVPKAHDLPLSRRPNITNFTPTEHYQLVSRTLRNGTF
jgi:hypothetical protein